MNRISKPKIFSIALIILSIFYLLMHLAVALRPPRALLTWFHIDDAYYYFQVARNLIEGHGFTFDRIGRSNGFHPLWMLVNIPVFYFARINPTLPFRILVMVSALITLGGAWILFDLLRHALRREAALLGFALWLFFWPTHNILTQTGMEAGINAFSMIGFLWLIHKLNIKRSGSSFLWLGTAAVLVLFARLDNIFLVFLFGLWLIFHQRPMRNLILLDTLAIFISAFTSIILRVGIEDSLGFLKAAQVLFLLAMITKSVSYYALGLYQHPKSIPVGNLVWRMAAATVISTGSLTALILGMLQLRIITNFPRSAILIDALLSLSLLILIRFMFQLASPEQPEANLSLKENARTWSMRSIMYLLPIGLFLGAYLLWNLDTFGTPLPISGQIKQWWGTILTVYGRRHRSLWTIFGMLPNTREDPQPWFLIQQFLYQPVYDLFKIDSLTQTLPYLTIKISLTAVYTGLLVWIYSRQAQAIREILHQLSIAPFLTSAVMLPLYYAFSGHLAMRNWYWVPQIILTLFLFLILMQVFISWVEKLRNPLKYLRFLPLGLVLILLFSFGIKLLGYFPAVPDEANTHDTLKITRYLESNTPEGSLIGMTGGGVEAYFIQDRTIINLDGLINSKEYFDLVRAGKGSIYLDQIGLDYVLARSVVLFDSDPYAWTFAERLSKIDTFEGFTLFIYSRQ